MAVYDFEFNIGQRAFYIRKNPFYREACRECNGTGIGERSICYACGMSGIGMYVPYEKDYVEVVDIGKIRSITILSDGVVFNGEKLPGLECTEDELFATKKEAVNFCKKQGWKVIKRR